MNKQDLTLTEFAGASIKGILGDTPIAEIQAIRTKEDGTISLIFIHFDRDNVVNESGHSHTEHVPSFDICIVWYREEHRPVKIDIKGVRLKSSDYRLLKNATKITPDDVVNGEMFNGTYESMTEATPI